MTIFLLTSALLGIIAGILYAMILIYELKSLYGSRIGEETTQSPLSRNLLIRSIIMFSMRYIFILWLFLFFLVKLRGDMITCLVFFGVSLWTYILFTLKGKV